MKRREYNLEMWKGRTKKKDLPTNLAIDREKKPK